MDEGPPEAIADGQSPQCPSLPASIAQLIPPSPTIAPVAAGADGTFHLCGADAQTARSIEQLVGGRGFSTTLSAHGDGCADLIIRVSSIPSNGSSSSNLSVSLGSGRSLVLQIASDQGATHVTIADR